MNHPLTESLDTALMRLLEAQLSIADDNYVNPFDRYMVNGELWTPVNNGLGSYNAMYADERIYWDQSSLDLVRRECRFLADKNPFAICGHESRMNYIIGWGFNYSVVAKDEDSANEDDVKAAQDAIDAFVKRNKWNHLEGELLYFRDRDGATLLRYHADEEGFKVRRVDVEQLKAPSDRQEALPYGIVRDPNDFDTITGFYIDGQLVSASEIQFRTRKACRIHQIGVPLFYGGKRFLHAAVKILINIAALSNMQSAIGAIRKFMNAAKSTVQTAVQTGANISRTSNAPGFGNDQSNERLGQEIPPGSVINTNEAVQWEFPAMANDPGKHIPPVQANLRAAGASASMPEYMFTGDASNANFASTQVAKDPAMRSFLKVQWEEVEYNREVIERLLEFEAARGNLPADILDIVEVNIEPPPLETESKKEKADIDKILHELHVKSKQTISAEHGLDYDQEQENFDAHEERMGDPLSSERPPLDDFGQPIDPAADPAEDPGQGGGVVPPSQQAKADAQGGGVPGGKN